ncbi:MAG: thiamine pyrophosphate-dependent enzyme [Fuerstiella sp.]|nr:thiamine pyrophosphate-dependent enzyme [Fuerstiella sp.]
MHVNSDAPTGFYQDQPPVECVCAVRVLTDRLLEACGGRVSWTGTEVAGLRRDLAEAIRRVVSATASGVSRCHFIKHWRRPLSVVTIVTGDVKAHKFVMSQVWTAPQPDTFLMSNGLSSVGYGPASAIAAAMVRPNRPVVSVTGDGEFAMMVQELETIRRVRVAPLFAVLCDRSLSII